jgi:hypothetical protein
MYCLFCLFYATLGLVLGLLETCISFIPQDKKAHINAINNRNSYPLTIISIIAIYRSNNTCKTTLMSSNDNYNINNEGIVAMFTNEMWK